HVRPCITASSPPAVRLPSAENRLLCCRPLPASASRPPSRAARHATRSKLPLITSAELLRSIAPGAKTSKYFFWCTSALLSLSAFHLGCIKMLSCSVDEKFSFSFKSMIRRHGASKSATCIKHGLFIQCVAHGHVSIHQNIFLHR